MRQIPTPAQAHEIVSVLNEELGADLDESVAARLAAGEDGIPFGGRHPDFAHGEDDSDGQSFFFYRNLGIDNDGAPFVACASDFRTLEGYDRLTAANRRLQSLAEDWHYAVKRPGDALRPTGLSI